jgi:sn-glycerol 3-phosphate transport system permease protein
MLANTLLMSLLVTGAQVLTSLLAAYAFAGWQFRGNRTLFLVFVGTWLVPFQVTMIPNYVLLARLGWLNTLAALVVPQFTAAFAIILLRQYMKAFPRELLDAARIDGASSWRPLLVTNKPEQSVIQVGMQTFLSQEGDAWGPLMAGATLACLPIFLLYVALQRQVTDACVRSGLK